MFSTIGVVAFPLINLLLALTAQEGTQVHGINNDRRRLKPILDEEFEAWINEKGFKWGMKGVAIAVTRRTKDDNGEWVGWETELKGYGVANRWGDAVDEDTLFGIGSNSKLFAALGIGLLVEDEKYPINWDTKIKDILPKGEWKLQDSVMEEQANLIDILSHRTGLPRHDVSYSRTDTLRTLVSKLRYLRPSAEFRQIWQYNNQMYSTVAYIMELLTNKTLPEFITEKIIKPVGMNFSTYLFDEAIKLNILADGFIGTESGNPKGEGKQKVIYKPIPYFDMKGNTSIVAGAAGIISSVRDLVPWLQTLILMGQHPITNESIIPKAAIEKAAEGVLVMQPSPSDPSMSPIGYGLGQLSFSYQGHYILEHGGVALGHYTTISKAPFDGIGIAILTNALPPGGSPLQELVKWRIYEKALGLKHIDWDSKYSQLTLNESGTKREPLITNKTATTLPISFYSGIYFNQAYGRIILCPYQDTSSIRSQQHRDHCQSTVAEISGTLTGPQPDFIFAWDKYGSTHVTLLHSDGDKFTARSLVLFPPPFPDNKDTEDSKSFSVEFGGLIFCMKFITDKGSDGKVKVIGIAFKDIWGSGRGAEILKGEDKGSAEVWFDRVGEL